MDSSHLVVLRELDAAQKKEPHRVIYLHFPYDRDIGIAGTIVQFRELNESNRVLVVRHLEGEAWNNRWDVGGNHADAYVPFEYLVSAHRVVDNHDILVHVDMTDAGWRKLLRPVSDFVFKRIMSRVHELPG